MKSRIVIGLLASALVAPASANPRTPSDAPVTFTEIKPAAANAAPRTEAVIDHDLDELRRTFTFGGKPVPPLIFRDFGDGNLADSKSIWVTVDLKAATRSNQYGTDIKKERDYICQMARTDLRLRAKDGPHEEESYRYLGATPSGLLVVVTIHTPEGGNEASMYLYVLEAARSAALDDDSKRYERITLTTVQRQSLGGWIGDASFAGDVLTLTKVDTGRGSRAEPITETKKFHIVRP